VDVEDPARVAFQRAMMRVMITIGARFGQTLAMVVGGEVVVVCVAFPPNTLDDGAAFSKGGKRWLYGVSEAGEEFDFFEMYDPAKAGQKRMARYAALGQTDMEVHHRKLPPHWYVQAFAVVPGHQREGYGRKMLSVVARWADRDGVGCYLESAGFNVPFYEKCGYRVAWTETLKDGDSELSVHGMWRDPQP